MHGYVLGGAANSSSGLFVQRRDGEKRDLLLMHDVQKRIRMGVGNTSKIIAARGRQTPAELNIPYPARLFSNSDKLNAAAQAHHHHNSLVRVIFGRAILVDATDPNAADGFLGRESRAQLGQRVECEGVIAKDAGLVDVGEQQDLLDAGIGLLGEGWLQARCDDEARLAKRIIRLGWDEDEVQNLGGGGAYIQVLIWSRVSVLGGGPG